jgi:hypothetical protein
MKGAYKKMSETRLVEVIWYNMQEEKKREKIEIPKNASHDEAVRIAYMKYGGTTNAPAELLTINM